MASSRPYRFPALSEEEPARRTSTRQSCGTCGASAVANCVALCCCPCAVVSCFTLALVKAPYVAGRRWVKLVKTRRLRGALRKTNRVRSLDDLEGLSRGQCDGTEVSSKDKEYWGELGRAAVFGWWGSTNGSSHLQVGEGRTRVSVTEKAWIEMYEVGHWGFGRLSFSVAGDAAATPAVRDDPEEDGSARVPTAR